MVAALFVFRPDAIAQHLITGHVHNGTTGVSVAGDQVILLRLSKTEGMVEESRSISDGHGSFHFQPRDLNNNVYVVRVLHSGVIYDRLLASSDTADMTVFDSRPKISGISGYASIVEVQSQGAGYGITELHAIQNNSNPRRTQLNSRNLEVSLPSNAQLDSVTALGPDASVPVKVTPLSVGRATYDIGFPLRPGMTQYAVRYHLLPESGKVLFHPRALYPTRQWTVVFPNTMQFMERTSGGFHSIVDQNGIRVEAINHVRPGALPEFEISGIGALPPMREAHSSSRSQSSVLTSLPATSGIATPRDQDKIVRSMTLIIVPFIMLLTTGIVLVRRTSKKKQANFQEVKDLLFDLENCRIQGTISTEQYAHRRRIINDRLERVILNA
jgi:hypothetical protein